jgi:MoaA/NifB/PqqE/SkfB family radical SAM enzyme
MLKKAADFGVDNLFISGAGWTGEPLMRSDFLELIRYVAELKLSPYIKVTGWHFDRKVAEELKAANCKAIVCFAGLKETDAKLRGKEAYQDSINAATLCREIGIPFAVSVINTKHVAHEVSALVQLAIE